MPSLPHTMSMLLMAVVMVCCPPPSLTLPPPLPAAPNKCSDQQDVAIVVDLSDSMSQNDAQEMQTPLKDLVNQVQLSPQGRHLTLMGYSDQILLKTALTGDQDLLRTEVDNMKPKGGPADTAMALKEMIATLEGPQGRPGARKACLLITDENSPNHAEVVRQAAEARRLGIEVRVVAVGSNQGSLDTKDLVPEDHVLHAEKYSQLAGILDFAASLLTRCPATKAQTTPTSSTSLTPVTTTPGGQQTVVGVYYIPPFMPLVYPLTGVPNTGTGPCQLPLTPLGYVLTPLLMPSGTSTLPCQQNGHPSQITGSQPTVTPPQTTQSASVKPCGCGGHQTGNLPYPWSMLYPQGAGLIVPVPLMPVGYLTMPGLLPANTWPVACQHTSAQPGSSVTPPVSTQATSPTLAPSTPRPSFITTRASSSITATTAPLATKVTPSLTKSTTSQTKYPTPTIPKKMSTAILTTRPTSTPSPTTTVTTHPTPTLPERKTTAMLTTQPTSTPSTARVTTPTPIAKTTRSSGHNSFILPGFCDDCLMVNGVGYKAHWSRCEQFVQCQELANRTVVGTVHQCPHGLHWRQSALTCERPQQAACSLDRCLQSSQGLYSAVNNCRGYWVCQAGRSEGKCCPPGYSFGGRIGCVPDTGCQDMCGVSPLVPRVCDKRAVPHMPLSFQQYIPGGGWKVMFCAPGTAYNHSTCACTDFMSNSTVPNRCRAELYLPFKGDVKDESGNNNYVQNEGVKVINGTGYFNGQASLRVPRFANMDYGDYLLIRLRYKQDQGAGRDQQALVANGDCLKPSSLYMVTGQQTTSFGSVTTTGQAAVVQVPSGGDGWKEAVMYVDRQTLTGSVNNFSMQTLFTGSLASSRCALQFGSGTNFRHFQGFMDDIAVYLCPPDTF